MLTPFDEGIAVIVGRPQGDIGYQPWREWSLNNRTGHVQFGQVPGSPTTCPRRLRFRGLCLTAGGASLPSITGCASCDSPSVGTGRRLWSGMGPPQANPGSFESTAISSSIALRSSSEASASRRALEVRQTLRDPAASIDDAALHTVTVADGPRARCCSRSGDNYRRLERGPSSTARDRRPRPQ